MKGDIFFLPRIIAMVLWIIQPGIISNKGKDNIKVGFSESAGKRSWRAKTADCNPSIVLWGRNFKPYKKFLPYFIFINLLAQEVRICSEVCFISKWNFFSYEFSTFFDLFAKNNCDVRGRTLSFFCLFFNFFQIFSKLQAKQVVFIT